MPKLIWAKCKDEKGRYKEHIFETINGENKCSRCGMKYAHYIGYKQNYVNFLQRMKFNKSEQRNLERFERVLGTKNPYLYQLIEKNYGDETDSY